MSDATGTPVAFVLTAAMLLLWVAAGFWFGFGDMLYQFVGSNVMSAASLLLLILLQASQNRETAATQAKLDELIRASAARNELVGVERLSDDEIRIVRRRIEVMAQAESYSRIKENGATAHSQVESVAPETGNDAVRRGEVEHEKIVP